MTKEKWEDTKDLVKDQFEVEEEGKEDIDPPQAAQAGGRKTVPNSTVEFIIFEGPLGRMKLEYITKPIVLDKKTIGSRRIGSDTTVEYIYSEDEFSNTFKAYKWEDERWEEMEKERLGAFTA
ncbi:MAG: hypothetical protein ABIH48_00840 [Candidatus Falkowbacteria bacterium]